MEKALVWFRRDLRDYDHAALSTALLQAHEVHCVFLFDYDILDPLPRTDRRVDFIWHSLVELDLALRQRGGGLIVLDGHAQVEIPALAMKLGVAAIFVNRDYEPSAKLRDKHVSEQLQAQGIDFIALKDQVIFDRDEVLTATGKPYTVFTPYSRNWLKQLALTPLPFFASAGRFATPITDTLPELAALGFCHSDLKHLGIHPGMRGAALAWEDFQERLPRYAELRDFPASNGVSCLSVHLRFGTLSIRQVVRYAAEVAASGCLGAEIWLKELIWRDFYFQILDHFPQVVTSTFQPDCAALHWDHWPAGFAAWQEGRTGYPLVDAGMRQLAQSGYLHNRLRMVTAAFLSKDLGIDWRLGEAHFALLLNDFDLAANNGGWQWSASTGCDAQPWFRIFNPVTQSEKFDPEGRFIRRYLPELGRVPDKYIHAPWRMSAAEQKACQTIIGDDYPAPIVDHAVARQRTLARFAAIKRRASPE